MKRPSIVFAVTTAALALVALAGHRPAGAETAAAISVEAKPGRKLFLDVHDIGKGKVKAKDVAEAHRRDLATEGKYGVDFKAYWVDEKEGKVYCLAEAPSADATRSVHKEAHGLLASKIMEVTSDGDSWAPAPGMKLSAR